VLGLVPYKEPVGFYFSDFSNIVHLTEFCRTRYFEFLNSVLTKTIEIDSSFLEFFISKFYKFLKNSNWTNWFSINR
jgi:hypothetical protein